MPDEVLSSFLFSRNGGYVMSQIVMVCITETLERVIEVDKNQIDGDAVAYVKEQYHKGEIILDSGDLVEVEFIGTAWDE